MSKMRKALGMLLQPKTIIAIGGFLVIFRLFFPVLAIFGRYYSETHVYSFAPFFETCPYDCSVDWERTLLQITGIIIATTIGWFLTRKKKDGSLN